MSWLMPHEGAPHERTWLAWPSSGYTLGDTPADAEEARTTWAAVANAITEFEPVSVVVDPRDRDLAPRYLSAAVECHEAPLDDAWMRDMGPTFVRSTETGALGAVDWVFNGWGAQDWASWEHDSKVGAWVADLARAELVPSALVNEGGGIHVDGAGTVLATETVQLDPGRNPSLTKADIEAEFARTLGATKTIWLPRGLTRDSERFGTRGHVDIVAAFARPGVVLLHTQRDESHPDFAVSRELRATLEAATDAAGRALEIVEVPAPTTLRDEDGWTDYSYINHLLVDGGVIACGFGDPTDAEAAGILADVYPGRRVVTVDARPLFARGGGIHCITQQQPA
ncbi:agmatine deiminase family protein [Leifsonia poae]|uniref:agmatine deiminase family protein n=1 Tax=Leifsonia poae TaxID=110933 RepID=UPI001CC132F7|nr:agmatine deiminase family protein [Leifsonia poae]